MGIKDLFGKVKKAASGDHYQDTPNTRKAHKVAKESYENANSKPGEMADLKVYEQSGRVGDAAAKRAANKEVMTGVKQYPEAEQEEKDAKEKKAKRKVKRKKLYDDTMAKKKVNTDKIKAVRDSNGTKK